MSDYFTTSADWAVYAKENGIALAEASEILPLESIVASQLDIPAQRAAQTVDESAWAREHPLSAVGYQSHQIQVSVRDGAIVDVKVSWPIAQASDEVETTSLPVVVVTHGGGWIQGTHVTEERWLLWPLFKKFKFITISIEYRLAPEHNFPTWHDDSLDVLQKIFAEPNSFLNNSKTKLDLENVILAGSSAGGCVAAVMAQECRNKGIKIKGVVLNSPVLCDYRHLPKEELRKLNKDGVLSWEQCTGAALSSGLMKAVWDLVLPSATEGSDLKASPLLGNLNKLPEHLIFVAGQDPLADEGRCYAQRLSQAGVKVSLEVYQGVPHAFAETHDLESTQKFWRDLQKGFGQMVNQAD